MSKLTYLMSFFPHGKKTAAQKFKNVVSHLIVCHKHALEFYRSIKPVPKHTKNHDYHRDKKTYYMYPTIVSAVQAA